MSDPTPRRLVILDIDGLRRDTFREALTAGRVPNLARLLGGPDAPRGLHFPAFSTAPSITFCAQTSLFTGQPPARHGIPGNQFFDRFQARYYAFDIGDTLAVDDAVLVFTGDGLLARVLPAGVPTLYELAGKRGLVSSVVYHMHARGAQTWIRPELLDIARLTRGGGLLGMSAEEYDGEMTARTVSHLRGGARPDILTAYWMGLDHQSHEHGPAAQADYLARTVDPLVGKLTAELERQDLFAQTLFAVVSDHGQIEVIPDDQHSLRMSFPFDREIARLFDSLGYDVHDLPGEDISSDAVIAMNGGIAHVYLKHRGYPWSHPVEYSDVLRAARAFWDAHHTGEHAVDFHQALALVLVRNTQASGWEAPYQVFHPDGRVEDLESGLAGQPLYTAADSIRRLANLAGPLSGDLLLHSNLPAGYYFGGPLRGTHGGLLPAESECVLSLGWPAGTDPDVQALIERSAAAVAARCQREDGRQPGVTDLLTAVSAALNWELDLE